MHLFEVWEALLWTEFRGGGGGNAAAADKSGLRKMHENVNAINRIRLKIL